MAGWRSDSAYPTAPLPGSAAWQDTAVLLPGAPRTTPAGWYDDPFEPGLLRYWDGGDWTDHTSVPAVATGSAAHCRPRRRSALVAFVWAFFFGGFAAIYLLPLPAWARLLIGLAALFLVGWWALLIIPLTWPFAIVAVPLLALAVR